MNCPKCGSADIEGRGFTKNRKKRQYECHTCGKWSNIALTWRDFSNVAKTHQELKAKLETSQVNASAKLPDSDIVLILGCMHLGNAGVDYDFFQELTDIIKEHKLRFIMAGDDIDWFFTNFYNALPVHEQVLTPDEQFLFLEQWLQEVGEYLVCSCWGNHDYRLEALTGLKFFDRLKSRFAPYFNGIGKLHLSVGKQKYEIVLTHKAPGYSTFNPLHGLFNLSRRIVDADLFIGGHTHDSARGKWRVREKKVLSIKASTLIKNDIYAERHFTFGHGIPEIPAVWFSAKEKKMVDFDDFRDALVFRDAMRG